MNLKSLQVDTSLPEERHFVLQKPLQAKAW
jgi:hypothetical protein